MPYRLPLVFALSIALAFASDLDVHFCPSVVARTYPLDSQHGLNLLVLQNAAVLNRTSAETEVLDCEMQLLRAGQAVDIRKISGTDLARHAKTSSSMQESGMLQLLPFQYAGLFPDGTKLTGPGLKPGEAMLITYEAFSFYGDRDQLRLVVHSRQKNGEIATSVASLPINTAPSKTSYRFPLRGRYFVAVGPTPHTPHRWARMEQFGYDVVAVGEGMTTHHGTGMKFGDYLAYGAEVMAMADGRVVAATNDQPENPETFRRHDETDEVYFGRVQSLQIDLLQHGKALGNYVTIDHGNGEFSLLAHLQPGSVTVRAGDLVKSGQVIGKLGGSGNSTEPHLHFQVTDGPDPLFSNGIPVNFTGVSMPLSDFPREIQSGDIVEAK